MKRARHENPAPDLRQATPLTPFSNTSVSTPQPLTKLAILAALGAELLDIETWRKGPRVAPVPIVTYVQVARVTSVPLLITFPAQWSHLVPF